MVWYFWRFNDWKKVLGGEWPSIEGDGMRGSGGLVHRALWAFA